MNVIAALGHYHENRATLLPVVMLEAGGSHCLHAPVFHQAAASSEYLYGD